MIIIINNAASLLDIIYPLDAAKAYTNRCDTVVTIVK